MPWLYQTLEGVRGWVGGLLALCKKELTQLPTFCIARYVRELVVEFFNISSCFCPLGLLFVTCRSSAALPLPPPLPSSRFLSICCWASLQNLRRAEVRQYAAWWERERERERALSKKLLFVSPQVDDAMLMFDKTTNRHRGEMDWPRLPSTLPRFFPLLFPHPFLVVYWSLSNPSTPPIVLLPVGWAARRRTGLV